MTDPTMPERRLCLGSFEKHEVSIDHARGVGREAGALLESFATLCNLGSKCIS